jgi:hypothetical protein
MSFCYQSDRYERVVDLKIFFFYKEAGVIPAFGAKNSKGLQYSTLQAFTHFVCCYDFTHGIFIICSFGWTRSGHQYPAKYTLNHKKLIFLFNI